LSLGRDANAFAGRYQKETRRFLSAKRLRKSERANYNFCLTAACSMRLPQKFFLAPRRVRRTLQGVFVIEAHNWPALKRIPAPEKNHSWRRTKLSKTRSVSPPWNVEERRLFFPHLLRGELHLVKRPPTLKRRRQRQVSDGKDPGGGASREMDQIAEEGGWPRIAIFFRGRGGERDSRLRGRDACRATRDENLGGRNDATMADGWPGYFRFCTDARLERPGIGKRVDLVGGLKRPSSAQWDVHIWRVAVG